MDITGPAKINSFQPKASTEAKSQREGRGSSYSQQQSKAKHDESTKPAPDEEKEETTQNSQIVDTKKLLDLLPKGLIPALRNKKNILSRLKSKTYKKGERQASDPVRVNKAL